MPINSNQNKAKKRYEYTSILKMILIICLIIGLIFTQTASALTRSEVSEQYLWELERIYPNVQAFNVDYSLVEQQYIPAMRELKDTLDSPANILIALQTSEQLMRTVNKLYVYSVLKVDENMADDVYLELSSRADSLYAEAHAAIAFINPEILTQPEASILAYMSDPLLLDYSYFFDRLIQQKKHTLTVVEEELLAQLSSYASAPFNIYNKLRLADAVYPEITNSQADTIELTYSNYFATLEDRDPSVRQQAFMSYFDVFEKNKNTYAALLETEVKKNIFFAEARNYESALAAALAQEHIPPEVYDNLISATNNNLASLHKYVDLRAKELNIDKVHEYDLFVPLVSEQNIMITYEEAKKLLNKGLALLGEDYLVVMQKAFNERWIDVYPTENKYSDAYQWGSYDTTPYVLLNYNDTVKAMLTFAHEVGHAVNEYYINSNQPYNKSGVTTFNAEIAAMTNELLMLRYLITNADSDQTKLYYINALVNYIRSAFYRQVMFAEFEQTIHEKVENGDALTTNTLRNIAQNLSNKYHGDSFHGDELLSMWWARVPHMYYNFYIYKYATSLAAAHQIVENITDSSSGGDYASRYLEFLKAGQSDYPTSILNKAGVDMTNPQAIDNLLKYFGDLVDEMERLLLNSAKKVSLRIGNDIVKVNGINYTLETAPYIDTIHNITIVPSSLFTEILGFDITQFTQHVLDDNYLPLRKTAEHLGASVTWDASNKEIIITY